MAVSAKSRKEAGWLAGFIYEWVSWARRRLPAPDIYYPSGCPPPSGSRRGLGDWPIPTRICISWSCIGAHQSRQRGKQGARPWRWDGRMDGWFSPSLVAVFLVRTVTLPTPLLGNAGKAACC